MPQAISMAIRQSIIRHYEQGETISFISRLFNVNRGTIYTLINRHKKDGEQGLKTDYNNCGKGRLDENDFIYRAVRCMRTWHPGWGSEKIHAEIAQMRPELKLPHYRTINRWFHWNNQLQPVFRSALPKANTKKAKYLHEGWQIDAKEEMLTMDGNKQCWLNIVDEYSGTVIAPPVFSL